MVSEYGYITLANLELFTGLDYSAIDGTIFADANVDKVITLAEKMVNGYGGFTGDQTSTDGIESATIYIAALILETQLFRLGYLTEENKTPLLTGLSILQILRMFLDNDSSIGVDAIPMSGANNNNADTL